jgi:hypothetical protein
MKDDAVSSFSLILCGTEKIAEAEQSHLSAAKCKKNP